MKYTNNFLGALCIATLGFASCADDYSLLDYNVAKPKELAALEYLSGYDDLKTYVDRSASPNFKLGAGVTVSEYNEGGNIQRVAITNFDEVTAGNAMKHASVVGNDGSMDFDPVTLFVTNAESFGQTVYGHTLAWHSQQNNRYLNNLIADFVDPDYVPELVPVTKTENRTCIIVESDDLVEAAWDTQFWLVFSGIEFKEGDTFSVKMNVRADKEASSGTQTHRGPGDYLHYVGIGTVSFTTEWAEYTYEGTIDASMAGGYSFAFNLNDFASANKYYFDDFSFILNGEELISNGDLNNPKDNANFYTKEKRGTPAPSIIVDSYEYTVMEEVPSTAEVERTCILVETKDMVSAPWDTQFWLTFPGVEFKEGDTWSVSMEIRAEKEASIGTQTHTNPGGYIHYTGIGTLPFTTEWEVYTSSGTMATEHAGGYSMALNLNDFASANKYYFDNISFTLNGEELIVNGDLDGDDMTNFVAKEYPAANGSAARKVNSYTVVVPGGRTPQTPEEKRDTLTWAMDNWISGMMTATKGKVVAWDAVNEPISGQDLDGDGFYDLWSTENPAGKDHFYWTDYLGNEDYVRMVIAKAREYYTGTEPLKLFINDYNLEGYWDDHKKLESLIHWIKVWESDGVTKIDGIGTQMHISYYADATSQAKMEECIVKQFEILAETGKLVKISELDMGYVDANGATVKTANMTEEQHFAMAEYYKFIIKKYFEIIPAEQQYGITHWSPTDSPKGSGWRAEEPVGLWDGNYNRKHVYAGFADGLAGAE